MNWDNTVDFVVLIYGLLVKIAFDEVELRRYHVEESVGDSSILTTIAFTVKEEIE